MRAEASRDARGALPILDEQQEEAVLLGRDGERGAVLRRVADGDSGLCYDRHANLLVGSAGAWL